MNKLTPTLLAAALAGATGLAAANEDKVAVESTTTTTTQQTTTTTTKPEFATFDVNSDGSIVLIEVADDKLLSSKFVAYDLDRDGKLSTTEFDDYVAGEVDIDVDVEVDDD
jgi:Ca2+-binding EF-hand superfamily protein